MKATTLINNTTINLSFGDAVRALFGRRIRITTEIDLAQEASVLETRQTMWVEPFLAGVPERAQATAGPYEAPATAVAKVLRFDREPTNQPTR